MVAVVEPALEPDAVESLVARLEDPKVAGALHDLLDHADLLAILAVGLHGFVSRGDTISNALAEGVSDLRAVQGSAGLPDLSQLALLAQRLNDLSGPLLDMLPTIEHLIRSGLGDPRVIDVAAMASQAAVRGAQEAQATQARISGVRALLRVLKDDDVSRALGFVVSIAKSLGQELKAAESRPVAG